MVCIAQQKTKALHQLIPFTSFALNSTMKRGASSLSFAMLSATLLWAISSNLLASTNVVALPVFLLFPPMVFMKLVASWPGTLARKVS